MIEMAGDFSMIAIITERHHQARQHHAADRLTRGLAAGARTTMVFQVAGFEEMARPAA